MIRYASVTTVLKFYQAYERYPDGPIGESSKKRGRRVDAGTVYMSQGATLERAHAASHVWDIACPYGQPPDPKLLKHADKLAFGEIIDLAWQDRNQNCVCLDYLPAALQFLNEHDFRLEKAQFEVVDDTNQVMGHPDMLGMLDGKHALISIKSGSLPDWWVLQEAGYVTAIGDLTLARVALHLPKLSRPQVEVATDMRDFNDWVTLVRAYQIAQRRIV